MPSRSDQLDNGIKVGDAFDAQNQYTVSVIPADPDAAVSDGRIIIEEGSGALIDRINVKLEHIIPTSEVHHNVTATLADDKPEIIRTSATDQTIITRVADQKIIALSALKHVAP